MRYDTSHLAHTKDAFKITDKTSEPEYNNIDTYAYRVPSGSTQSPLTERQGPQERALKVHERPQGRALTVHERPQGRALTVTERPQKRALAFHERPQETALTVQERPHERALTVKDVVFSERMTLTPPLEPKLNDQQPTRQIVANPYIVNHSYTIIPNSIPQQSEGYVVKTQKNSRSDKIHRSKSTGVKSLQMMSQLQKGTTKGQKKNIQLTKAKSSQMRNQEFEKSLLALFENSQSHEHNAEDMLNAMQLMLMDKSSTQRPVLMNPSPPHEQSKDRFTQNQSTIRIVQHLEEKSSSSVTQNHAANSYKNRPYQQTFYPERKFMSRNTPNITHPDITQNTTTQRNVSQKQSLSEQTVTQNSTNKNSGQASHTVTVTEKSEVCTEVKSAVQTSMGMKAHNAIAPKLPHQ